MPAVGTVPQNEVVPRGCNCGARIPIGVKLGLKSRTRPVFEGAWSCGESCLRRAIGSAVARECSTTASRRTHRHRVPLGLMLLSAGCITSQQLRRALEIKQNSSLRIGEILQQEYDIDEGRITLALSTQWGCQVWEPRGNIAPGMACVAPMLLLETSGMLPMRMSSGGERIALAFEETSDSLTTFALQRMHGTEVEIGIVSSSNWRALRTSLQGLESVPMVGRRTSDRTAAIADMARNILRLQPVESRMVRIRQYLWLRVWLERAAVEAGPCHRDDIQDFVYEVSGIGS